MADLTYYKFETHPGLPPAGEQGQFYGFNDDGWTFVLRWLDRRDGGFWVAIGFEAVPHGTVPLAPLIVECREARANFIVSWSPAPMAWADAGVD